jgi:hypothetical protein
VVFQFDRHKAASRPDLVLAMPHWMIFPERQSSIRLGRSALGFMFRESAIISSVAGPWIFSQSKTIARCVPAVGSTDLAAAFDVSLCR